MPLFPNQTSSFLNAFHLDMARGTWFVPVLNGGRIEQCRLTGASGPRFVETCRNALTDLSHHDPYPFPGDHAGMWSFHRSVHPARLALYRDPSGLPSTRIGLLMGQGPNAADFDLEYAVEPMGKRGNPGIKASARARLWEPYGFSFHISLEGIFVGGLKRFLGFKESAPLDRIIDSLAEFVAPDAGSVSHLPGLGILHHRTCNRMDKAYGFGADGKVAEDNGEFREFVSLYFFIEDSSVYAGKTWEKLNEVWRYARRLIIESARSDPNEDGRDKRYADLIAAKTYRTRRG